MVFCCVFGCSNRSENSKCSFYRIPSVISHHDPETKILSEERRAKWFASIKREHIKTNATHYRVCSQHFISGKSRFDQMPRNEIYI